MQSFWIHIPKFTIRHCNSIQYAIAMGPVKLQSARYNLVSCLGVSSQTTCQGLIAIVYQSNHLPLNALPFCSVSPLSEALTTPGRMTAAPGRWADACILELSSQCICTRIGSTMALRCDISSLMRRVSLMSSMLCRASSSESEVVKRSISVRRASYVLRRWLVEEKSGLSLWAADNEVDGRVLWKKGWQSSRAGGRVALRRIAMSCLRVVFSRERASSLRVVLADWALKVGTRRARGQRLVCVDMLLRCKLYGQPSAAPGQGISKSEHDAS